MIIESVAIDKVIPYARNPRKNDGAIAKVAASIKEFGWRQPIVVDAEMVVIAGHTRLEAARQLGMPEVPVHVATGLSPEQIRAYRIADNRSGQEAEWDAGLLKLELDQLQALGYGLQETGFSMQEVEAILQPVEVAVPEFKTAERRRIEADINKIVVAGRRIEITPEELKRGMARVANYVQRGGALYGFVSELLAIESIHSTEGLV